MDGGLFRRASVALAMLAVLGAAGAGQTKQPPAPPNIVLILADDLGYGDVGAFNPKSRIPTPTLDRLARDGVRYVDAHSNSAVCTPTRYGLLTGRYAWRTSLESGVLWGEGEPLIEPSRVTLASMLRAQGYATAVMGKWHLGLGWATKPGATRTTRTRNEIGWIDFSKPFTGGPTALGFDTFFGIAASLDMPPYVYLENDRAAAEPTLTLPGVPPGNPAFYRPGPAAPGFQPENVLRDVTARSVAYIRERGKQKQQPFFLYVALASPHTPVMPTKFRGRTGIGMYGDFVAETDAAVGELLRALDESGLTPSTLVFFLSDNGPAPLGGIAEAASHGHDASGGWRGVKAGLYEGGHRVPFIARWPGRIRAMTTSTRTIGTNDIIASIADVVGVKLPQDAAEDSVSFAGNLLDANRGLARGPALILHSQNGAFAVRQGPWKLILGHAAGVDNDPPAGGLPPRQLFNLQKDPKETTNVAAHYPFVVRDLEAVLKKYRDSGRSRD